VDFSEIQTHFAKSKKIIFFEEHELDGGLSQKMAASLEGPRQNIYIHAAQKTVINGSRNFILERQGFTAKNMRALVTRLKESCR
jgi:transketolase C-terminal domain/subunit